MYNSRTRAIFRFSSPVVILTYFWIILRLVTVLSSAVIDIVCIILAHTLENSFECAVEKLSSRCSIRKNFCCTRVVHVPVTIFRRRFRSSCSPFSLLYPLPRLPVTLFYRRTRRSARRRRVGRLYVTCVAEFSRIIVSLKEDLSVSRNPLAWIVAYSSGRTKISRIEVLSKGFAVSPPLSGKTPFVGASIRGEGDFGIERIREKTKFDNRRTRPTGADGGW